MEKYRDITQVLALQEPLTAYNLDLIEACRKGVSRNDFLAFVKRIGESIQSLSEIMPSSYSSLTKKKIYDSETSERILELASLYAFGQEVFGDMRVFKDWLHRKSMALGGNTPFSLLDTSFGFQMVRDELGRIDYGIY